MFLHLGGDVSILQKEVIGIFDLETSQRSIMTKEFINLAKSEKKVVYVANTDKAKSFVLTKGSVFFSPISSITLQKRVKQFWQEI